MFVDVVVVEEDEVVVAGVCAKVCKVAEQWR